MQLVFIGELISKTTKEIQSKNQQIPWRDLKDLRNTIAHEYLGVDANHIYLIVTKELPEIKPKLEKILDDLKNSPKC